ncbi:MAG: thiamine phosphate synthase, partial [Clostridia bacterium]|nr:thiamine phosphate synthase [Clostridia bacterium]
KGLLYLREVAQSVSIPVYGIGGVSLERMPEVLAAGAAGGCMMSAFMKM